MSNKYIKLTKVIGRRRVLLLKCDIVKIVENERNECNVFTKNKEVLTVLETFNEIQTALEK